MKNKIYLCLLLMLAVSGCAYSVKKNSIQLDKVGAEPVRLELQSFKILECDAFAEMFCSYISEDLQRSIRKFAVFTSNPNSNFTLKFYQESPDTIWPVVSALTLGIIPVYETTNNCLEFSDGKKLTKFCSDYRTYYWIPFIAAFIHKSGIYTGLESNFQFLINELISSEDFNAATKKDGNQSKAATKN